MTRQWRVGTFSMAFSLILVGVILLLTEWTGTQATESLLLWWPIVFVLLGLEILLYTFLRREQAVIKYDVFSILFVGLLGMVCLALVGLTSTGVMQEIRFAVGAVESTVDLPAVKQDIPSSVNRIVVRNESGYSRPLRVESSPARELNLFGQYRLTAKTGMDVPRLDQTDVLSTRTVDQTLYVTLKRPPESQSFVQRYSDMALTLVLPKEMQVEFSGGYYPQMDEAAKGAQWTVAQR
ncbi:exosporium protein E [Paenibacillus koleovorans]|uniref:exosporium protein E n=1 Tax=Paenibacillus koleovorans TaxID=121608 RepID=UPI000FDC0BD0|nr:exosporium protein E [Paenibacillus koleovorans]